MSSDEYSGSHQDPGHGRRYEMMYTGSYYRQLWSDIEQPLLRDRLEEVASKADPSLLIDLACGTGRVTLVGSDLFARILGIDISAEMLEIARARCAGSQNVAFLQVDVKDPDAVRMILDGYGSASCITAFRLFTNADPGLRRLAAEFAYAVLRPGGSLICNTHMVPVAPVGTFYRFEHRLRRLLRRRQRMFNKVLSPEDLGELLIDAGFTELSVEHYGALPGIPKLWRFVPEGQVARAERRFGGRTWNQCALLVARR